MPTDLTTHLGPLVLRNPVLTASGTFGFGEEYAEFEDLNRLGGVMVKGTTLHPREGNPAPRVTETPAGMLNAIGLQNPGVDAVIAHKLPFLSRFSTAVIVNISGESIEDYVEIARRLDAATRDSADHPSPIRVDALELNISCPNVKVGGMAFGVAPVLTRDLVAAVRAETKLPLITKLSPNVTDIVSIARAAVEAGSDALSLINTLLGEERLIAFDAMEAGKSWGGIAFNNDGTQNINSARRIELASYIEQTIEIGVAACSQITVDNKDDGAA